MTQEPQTTLYTLSTCVHCKHAREFLEENRVNFTCILVDKLQGDERKNALSTVRACNPRVSFPTLVTSAGAVVVGFKKDEMIEALGL